MRFFLFSLALLLSTNVWAAISVTGISGVSSSSLSGTPSIFGAVGGADCSGDPGVTTTSSCNSCRTAALTCPTAPLCVCSEARIHGNLHVHITLKKDAADTGPIKAQIVRTTDGTAPTPVVISSTSDDTSIDFAWSEMCKVLDNLHVNCEGGTATNSGTLTIWADKNSDNLTTDEAQTTVSVRLINPPDSEVIFGKTGTDGIGAFTPYPGDEKVFIEDTKAGSGFPNLVGGGISSSVRVFISDKNLDDAYPQGPTLLDGDSTLPIDTATNELTEHTVKGLVNETRYYFRIAIVDNAGNISQYFPPYLVTDGAFGTECTTGAGPDVECLYSAKPDQVLGLLTKDINCFIATAAYGSSMEPKLQTFRDFRYKILLRHDWGVRFVKWYYNYGPKAAQFIYDKPAVRAVARGLLWPVFGFTWMSLRLGLVPTSLLFLLLLTSLTIPLWLSFRRSTPRV